MAGEVDKLCRWHRSSSLYSNISGYPGHVNAGVNDAGGQFTADKDTGHKPELVKMYLSEFLNINLRSPPFFSVQHRRLTDIGQIEYSLSLIC